MILISRNVLAFLLISSCIDVEGSVELDVELTKCVVDFLIDTEVRYHHCESFAIRSFNLIISDLTSLLHEQVLKLLVTLLSSQLTTHLEYQSPQSNLFFSHLLNPAVIDPRRCVFHL